MKILVYYVLLVFHVYFERDRPKGLYPDVVEIDTLKFSTPDSIRLAMDSIHVGSEYYIAYKHFKVSRYPDGHEDTTHNQELEIKSLNLRP